MWKATALWTASVRLSAQSRDQVLAGLDAEAEGAGPRELRVRTYRAI